MNQSALSIAKVLRDFCLNSVEAELFNKVGDLLPNRVYIGEAVHKGTGFPGEHKAIIDKALWDKVHGILKESPRKRAANTRAQTPALLKGLIFTEAVDRGQSTLFPDRLEDWIGEDNPVRVVDVFVDELDLGGVGFGRVEPLATGRPGYHPAVLLKHYI